MEPHGALGGEWRSGAERIRGFLLIVNMANPSFTIYK